MENVRNEIPQELVAQLDETQRKAWIDGHTVVVGSSISKRHLDFALQKKASLIIARKSIVTRIYQDRFYKAKFTPIVSIYDAKGNHNTFKGIIGFLDDTPIWVIPDEEMVDSMDLQYGMFYTHN